MLLFTSTYEINSTRVHFMTRLKLRSIITYLKETYLPYWYNHTMPLPFSKVAEDECDFRITEKHLHAVWNNQKLLRTELIDDQKNKVQIIKLGTWNREPGPDFKKALISINGQNIAGDIEIHLTPELWNSHGHQYDSNYQNVVLHVVWENPYFKRTPAHIPILEMKSQLSTSEDKVWEMTNLNTYSKSHMHPPVDCSQYINQISDEQLTKVFTAAGLSRLQRKTDQFKLSVLKYGFQQAFLLLLGDAHGFKNNRQPFRQLLNAANIDKLNSLSNNKQKEALLWGNSHLLPDPSQFEIHKGLQPFTKNMWREWWPLRDEDSLSISWSRSSQRPLNSPERRLAALICLLEKCHYQIDNTLQECRELIKTPNLLKKWFDQLFEFDSLWSGMANFTKKLKTPCRLIGNARQLDIIINVFIPAIAFLNNNDRKANEDLYLFYCSLPKSQDNHILDIARHRFFLPPSRMKYIIKKAVDQQGLMQLMQDFDLPTTEEAVISFWEELGIQLVKKEVPEDYLIS